jgi:hypothetical protein
MYISKNYNNQESEVPTTLNQMNSYKIIVTANEINPLKESNVGHDKILVMISYTRGRISLFQLLILHTSERT